MQWWADYLEKLKAGAEIIKINKGVWATASSILNEQGFSPDAIERQLSHIDRNQVRSSYTHHARFLKERTAMMQWWADYIDNQQLAGRSVQ